MLCHNRVNFHKIPTYIPMYCIEAFTLSEILLFQGIRVILCQFRGYPFVDATSDFYAFSQWSELILQRH